MLYLFNVGDKIVYPSQGVGIIDVIEEKEFSGKLQKYYKIHLINNNLKLLLPANRSEICHLRLISDSKHLDKVLNNITKFTKSLEELISNDCKIRLQNNTLKFKSGTLEDFVEVVSDLTTISKDHNLNTSEKQMLNTTKKFLINEIKLSKNISNDEATDLLNSSLALI
ncbi:CarD family transcriptional regulator [Clostridium moniliforme]|uniref:CarD family transcriptional regulator n=1 Tax=Clostridium moniliforme TaxID=39489 RepID=UPI002E16FD13